MKDNKTIFYVCPTCNSKFNYVPSECHFCGRIKKTNADRIRAMSDEELHTFLNNWLDCPYGKTLDWIDWLKQEVE